MYVCMHRVTNAAESDKVSFLEASNIVFMGCNVVEGEGTGIVIATGPNNQVLPILSWVVTSYYASY